MTNITQVQTVSSAADKVRLAAAALLLLGSLVAFYALGQQDTWVRVAALFGLLLAALGAFLSSETGKQFMGYVRESVREAKKVVWPTRQEAMQMTGYVFAFVVVMAIMLWLTDKTLEWLLYSVILGWRH